MPDTDQTMEQLFGVGMEQLFGVGWSTGTGGAGGTVSGSIEWVAPTPQLFGHVTTYGVTVHGPGDGAARKFKGRYEFGLPPGVTGSASGFMDQIVDMLRDVEEKRDRQAMDDIQNALTAASGSAMALARAVAGADRDRKRRGSRS